MHSSLPTTKRLTCTYVLQAAASITSARQTQVSGSQWHANTGLCTLLPSCSESMHWHDTRLWRLHCNLGGIVSMDTRDFRLRCFQTLTGVKFIVTANSSYPDQQLQKLLQGLYQLFAEFGQSHSHTKHRSRVHASKQKQWMDDGHSRIHYLAPFEFAVNKNPFYELDMPIEKSSAKFTEQLMRLITAPVEERSGRRSNR